MADYYLERGTSGANVVNSGTFAKKLPLQMPEGVYVEYSENLLEDLTMSGNTAKNGSRVYVVGNASKPAVDYIVKGCEVTGNTATNSSGGIYLNKSGSTGKLNLSCLPAVKYMIMKPLHREMITLR